MAVEIGEFETRVEAAPAPDAGARRPPPPPDPRALETLLRRQMARRARLRAD